MVTTKRRDIVLCLFLGLLIIFACGSAWAIPVRLPSGKLIDLTPNQVKLLKQSPGVYYIDHRPDKIISGRIRHWTLIELPQELGGGFLIGNPQNMARGLEMIDAREIQDSGIAASKSSPDGSDSQADIKPVRTKDAPHQNDWRLSIDIGYRADDFDWNIAGDISGNNPNILSELTWNDLEILQLELGLAKIFPYRFVGFVLKGEIAYGFIFDGENQDSDYFGDNRTGEFSRSNNSTEDGNTSDVSIGVGFNPPVLSVPISSVWNFSLGTTFPIFGFSFHSQNLTITEGFQTIPPLGPFPGLNSSYDAEWYGPWVGFELNAKIYKRDVTSPAHEFFFGIEYHWADYYAEANWNLRTDLAHPKSFEHEADGSGRVLSAGYNYFFNPQWSLNFIYKKQKWETDPGIDRVFFADGTEAATRLNEVNWKSSAIMVGVTRSF
jgi:hypothetical protein